MKRLIGVIAVSVIAAASLFAQAGQVPAAQPGRGGRVRKARSLSPRRCRPMAMSRSASTRRTRRRSGWPQQISPVSARRTHDQRRERRLGSDDRPDRSRRLPLQLQRRRRHHHRSAQPRRPASRTTTSGAWSTSPAPTSWTPKRCRTARSPRSPTTRRR